MRIRRMCPVVQEVWQPRTHMAVISEAWGQNRSVESQPSEVHLQLLRRSTAATNATLLGFRSPKPKDRKPRLDWKPELRNASGRRENPNSERYTMYEKRNQSRPSDRGQFMDIVVSGFLVGQIEIRFMVQAPPRWWKKWPRRRCCHWLGLGLGLGLG